MLVFRATGSNGAAENRQEHEALFLLATRWCKSLHKGPSNCSFWNIFFFITIRVSIYLGLALGRNRDPADCLTHPRITCDLHSSVLSLARTSICSPCFPLCWRRRSSPPAPAEDGWTDGRTEGGMDGDLRPSCRCLRSWLRCNYREETAARGLSLRTSAVIVFGGEVGSLWLDGLILHAAGSKGVAQQTKRLCE